MGIIFSSPQWSHTHTHNAPSPTLHTPKHTLILPPSPQPCLPNNASSNNPPQPRANTDQHARPHIPAIHKDLQRRNIIHNNRPTNRRRTTRQIVIPNNQQYREQLRAATNQQRGAERRGVRVVRHSARPPCSQRLRQLGRVEGREEADGKVKSEGAERDEGQEEEILQHEGLGVQDCGVRGCGGGEGGGCAWQREFLDARPC